jgi:hypothetical protein
VTEEEEEEEEEGELKKVGGGVVKRSTLLHETFVPVRTPFLYLYAGEEVNLAK